MITCLAFRLCVVCMVELDTNVIFLISDGLFKQYHILRVGSKQLEA